jgi:hypothetical protein
MADGFATHTPQQVEGGRFSQVEELLDGLPVDAFRIGQRQGFEHFWNAMNPGRIGIHGRPPAFHYASERSFAVHTILRYRKWNFTGNTGFTDPFPVRHHR